MSFSELAVTKLWLCFNDWLVVAGWVLCFLGSIRLRQVFCIPGTQEEAFSVLALSFQPDSACLWLVWMEESSVSLQEGLLVSW